MIVLRFSTILFLLACASPPPRGVATPDPAHESEEVSLKRRFEAAYFEIACMANRGVDPLMTIKPLRKPLDYLDGLVERKDPDLEPAMRALERNGFPSIESFRAVEVRLRADRAYWNKVDERFVDELLKCR